MNPEFGCSLWFRLLLPFTPKENRSGIESLEVGREACLNFPGNFSLDTPAVCEMQGSSASYNNARYSSWIFLPRVAI